MIETVACAQCGHIVLKSSASYIICNSSNYWYCSDHHKPFDECYSWYGDPYKQYAYYRKMRVDEHGTPIGYVKIPDASTS